MSRRKFKTVADLENAWEDFKRYCDNQEALTHDFSSKNSEFVSKELTRSITYTIKGFCLYVGISRKRFYQYYAKSKTYGDIVTRMREECEVNARTKFEFGVIPSRLAGLWMSKYGYGSKEKTVTNISSNLIDALNGKAENT